MYTCSIKNININYVKGFCATATILFVRFKHAANPSRNRPETEVPLFSQVQLPAELQERWRGQPERDNRVGDDVAGCSGSPYRHRCQASEGKCSGEKIAPYIINRFVNLISIKVQLPQIYSYPGKKCVLERK
jgi:hypothetical protein